MTAIHFHPHAVQRLAERGATRAEVLHTVRHGKSSPAKFGRTRFTHRFAYNRLWLGTRYAAKQVETFAARQPNDDWIVITVIVKFLERP